MPFRLIHGHAAHHGDFAAGLHRRMANPGRLLRRRRAASRTISILPTLFTLGNALCGFLAVFFASRPADVQLPWNWTPLTFAVLFVFLGMVFDVLDGRIARLTRHTSDLGMELDSMSDMVTFGVAPAFIAVQLVVGSETPFFASDRADTYFGRCALVVACIYVACTALRLARFNVEVRSPLAADHMYFKGLPSPGAAGTVASIVLLHQHFLADYFRKQIVNPDLPLAWTIKASAIVMVAVMLLTAFAMVSRLRYVHVINRYVRGRARFTTVAKIVIVVLPLMIFPQQSIAAALLIYALSAPAVWFWQHLAGKEPTLAPVAPPQAAPPVTPTPRRDVG